MADSVLKVPCSLGSNAQTSAPIYLALKYAKTSQLLKTRDIETLDENASVYLLPPPKQGLGQSTQNAALDEVNMWTNSMSSGDKFRAVMGDTVQYGVGKIIELAAPSSSVDYLAGGARVPKDITALSFKGIRKRTYSFSIQLFAYTADDVDCITNFVNNMHLLTLPEAAVEEEGAQTYFAPAIFQPSIVNYDGSTEVQGWLVQPRPCFMLTFNTSGGQFASVGNASGRPGVITVNMLMAEIEPVVAKQDDVVIASKAFATGEEG